MKRALLPILGVLAAGAAGAQPAAPPTNVPDKIERVIVTAPRWMGDKPDTVIHNFVNSYVMASTPTVGEISRWKFALCTRTYGLSKPEYDRFVTDRIENIAVEAGAEIRPAPCHYNVEVIFTAQPQQFLDRVRAEGVQLLGPRPSHADRVSQKRYPSRHGTPLARTSSLANVGWQSEYTKPIPCCLRHNTGPITWFASSISGGALLLCSLHSVRCAK